MLTKVESFLNLYFNSDECTYFKDWSYKLNDDIHFSVSVNLFVGDSKLMIVNKRFGKIINFKIINDNGYLHLIENYLNRQHGISMMYCSNLNEFLGENQEDFSKFLDELKLKYI